jgi:large subunit ribosomal protein L20|tara:strand:- start:12203 stop:12550 length:348 start_codon:yes stop_codon:yes gene_type:complete
MPRVKRGTIKLKRRRNILKQVKGYRLGRSTKEKQAKEAIAHSGVHAFSHRRDKKGVFRRLWNVRINAATRPLGFSYSSFIGSLKKKNIALDRKVLSQIAEENPDTFKRIVENLEK